MASHVFGSVSIEPLNAFAAIDLSKKYALIQIGPRRVIRKRLQETRL